VSEENTGGYSQKYISSAKEHVGFEERKRGKNFIIVQEEDL